MDESAFDSQNVRDFLEKFVSSVVSGSGVQKNVQML